MKSRRPTHKNSPADLEDNPFYQAAVAELDKGYVRLNLMADALAKASQDETAARLLYLQQVAIKLQQEQKLRALLNPKAPQEKPISPFDRYISKLKGYWPVLPAMLLCAGLYWIIPDGQPQVLLSKITAILDREPAVPTDRAADYAYPATAPIPSDQDRDQTAEQHYPSAQPAPVLYTESARTTASSPAPRIPNPDQDRQVTSYQPSDGNVWVPDDPPATEPTPICQHKAVMSDQDYINCGIRPPTT